MNGVQKYADFLEKCDRNYTECVIKDFDRDFLKENINFAEVYAKINSFSEEDVVAYINMLYSKLMMFTEVKSEWYIVELDKTLYLNRRKKEIELLKLIMEGRIKEALFEIYQRIENPKMIFPEPIGFKEVICLKLNLDSLYSKILKNRNVNTRLIDLHQPDIEREAYCTYK